MLWLWSNSYSLFFEKSALFSCSSQVLCVCMPPCRLILWHLYSCADIVRLKCLSVCVWICLSVYLSMFIGFCPGQSVCSLVIYFLWFTSPSPFSFSSLCFMFIGLPGFDPCLCSRDFVSALPRLLFMTSFFIPTLISACSQINQFFSTPTTLCIWVLPHTPPSQSVTPLLITRVGSFNSGLYSDSLLKLWTTRILWCCGSFTFLRLYCILLHWITKSRSIKEIMILKMH